MINLLNYVIDQMMMRRIRAILYLKAVIIDKGNFRA